MLAHQSAFFFPAKCQTILKSLEGNDFPNYLTKTYGSTLSGSLTPRKIIQSFIKDTRKLSLPDIANGETTLLSKKERPVNELQQAA